MELTVTKLAERVGAELVGGDGGGRISAVAGAAAAGAGDVTFVTDAKHIAKLEKSAAGAVITATRIDGFAGPQLIVKNVTAVLIEVLNIFAPELDGPTEGVDPSAKVGEGVEIGEGVSIGANAVLGRRVKIGDNTVIGSGCKIGENSKIGKNCRIDDNVVIYHNCTVGSNVIIQANTTIGSTGFGYSFTDDSCKVSGPKLIPHNGVVVIEDFVEIGANCCIDRAKFSETRIGAGTKIDNLVQIAHNVIIGRCCLITAQVGIAGSAILGDGVIMAGHSGVGDNVEVGAGVIAGVKSAIMRDISAGKQMFGTPAIEKNEAFKRVGWVKRIPKLFERLKQLTARVDKLEAAKDNRA